MPLDGYTLFALAREIAPQIVGGRIDRVTQPQAREIVLQIRNQNRTCRLLLRPDPSLPAFALIEEKRNNPQQAPGFCMFLRKHLIGAKILACSTRGTERIVDLRVEQRDELGDLLCKTLVLELLGRQSNLILLTDSGKILDALIHVDSSLSRTREILPARTYVAPSNPGLASPQEWIQSWEDPLGWRVETAAAHPSLSIKEWLVQTGMGVSPWLAEGWCQAIELSPNTALESVPLTNLESLRLNLLSWMEERPRGALYRNIKTGRTDFHSWLLPHSGWLRSDQPTLSEAMEKHLTHCHQLNLRQQERTRCQAPLLNRLKTLKKKEKIFTQDIRSAQNYALKKEAGELLLANLHRLQGNETEIRVQDYYDPKGGERVIPLFPNRTGSQCAQIYFKQYNKEKNRLERATQFLEETREEITYLEGLLHTVESAETPDDFRACQNEWSAWDERARNRTEQPNQEERHAAERNRFNPGKPGKRSKRGTNAKNFKEQKKKKIRQEAPLPPRRHRLSNGLIIELGRNNLQNDQLTHRRAQASDWWLHRKNAPGPHCILYTQGQVPSEETLSEAATCCAWYSLTSEQRQLLKGGQKGEKIEIDACPVARVYKPRKAKPGYVEFTGQQTLLVQPCEPESAQDQYQEND